jgi:hypothetical protein
VGVNGDESGQQIMINPQVPEKPPWLSWKKSRGFDRSNWMG